MGIGLSDYHNIPVLRSIEQAVKHDSVTRCERRIHGWARNADHTEKECEENDDYGKRKSDGLQPFINLNHKSAGLIFLIIIFLTHDDPPLMFDLNKVFLLL